MADSLAHSSAHSVMPQPLSPGEGNSARPTLSLRPAAAIHLVGIAGAGMRALAELLASRGFRVTGSDSHLTAPVAASLRLAGIMAIAGHDARYLPAGVSALIHSHAINERNPELLSARERDIPCLSYPQMLGCLADGRTCVAVAGTHGKTTTSAMLAWILDAAGVTPAAIFGGELRGGPAPCLGDGEHFVVEACEYRHSFLNFRPSAAIVTSVEADHFDCFPAAADLDRAFAEFVACIDPAGWLVVPAGNVRTATLAAKFPGVTRTFSLTGPADWTGRSAVARPGPSRMVIRHRGQRVCEVVLPIPGQHNQANALAAIAAAAELGIAPGVAAESLADFSGLKRRFEVSSLAGGLTLVEDYAHHPTAVMATLETAREQFPGRRLWCVFQPHQISRTQALMSDFAASFELAEGVFVMPVYAAREAGGAACHDTAEQLSREISGRGVPAQFQPTLETLLATLDDHARPGDVVLTLGAGDIDRLAHEFSRRLFRHHAS